MLPVGYKFLHLSSESKWQEAESLVGQRLVTTRPDEAHGLVFCTDCCWALVRCPMTTPYSLTLECCDDDGDSDQHVALWEAVQHVAAATVSDAE